MKLILNAHFQPNLMPRQILSIWLLFVFKWLIDSRKPRGILHSSDWFCKRANKINILYNPKWSSQIVNEKKQNNSFKFIFCVARKLFREDKNKPSRQESHMLTDNCLPAIPRRWCAQQPFSLSFPFFELTDSFFPQNYEICKIVCFHLEISE